MPINQADTLDFLSHHGIKGQKWGVRHGPPYPLTAQAKAKAYPKKDKGSTRFGGNNDSDGNGSKKKSSIDAKTVAKVAAVAAIATAALIVAPKVIRAVKSQGGGSLSSDSNALKLLKNRETERIDPKTGLYLKKEDLGIDNDLKVVNPNFKNGKPFQVNCTMCTAAMEMRRRGYDVAASGLMNTSNNGLSADVFTKWFKPPTEHKPFSTTSSKSRDALKEAVSKQGNGARGEIGVRWLAGGGHSMFYQVEQGKMVIYDGQSGKKYDGSKLDKLLSNTGMAMVRRLDNLQPDMDAINNGIVKPLC